MANVKAIQRKERFEIRMSKEEKDLFYKYAEQLGINPSRLGRNIIMSQAEIMSNKSFNLPLFVSYISYLKVTNQKFAFIRNRILKNEK